MYVRTTKSNDDRFRIDKVLLFQKSVHSKNKNKNKSKNNGQVQFALKAPSLLSWMKFFFWLQSPPLHLEIRHLDATV